MSIRKKDNVVRTALPKVDPAKAKWWVIDLDGRTLGRTAVTIANILRGKNKPTFTPHIDTGDHVIVLNAAKVRVTGRKSSQIEYYNYSGYPGGLYKATFEEMIHKHPERVIEHAVKGMLPKSILGRKQFSKLHVYIGSAHPHQAQKPESLAHG